MKAKLFLATDHAGYAHKNVVQDFLLAQYSHEYIVVDKGAFSLNEQDDYPDFVAPAARAVAQNPTENKAIIFGGSGQGEAMLANKFQNVRATVFYGGKNEILTLSREHNDANVLSIGARFITEDEAIRAVDMWLSGTPSIETRHKRRLAKLATYESRRFWQRFINLIRG